MRREMGRGRVDQGGFGVLVSATRGQLSFIRYSDEYMYFCTSVILYLCTSVILYFCTSVLSDTHEPVGGGLFALKFWTHMSRYGGGG